MKAMAWVVFLWSLQNPFVYVGFCFEILGFVALSFLPVYWKDHRLEADE